MTMVASITHGFIYNNTIKRKIPQKIPNSLIPLTRIKSKKNGCALFSQNIEKRLLIRHVDRRQCGDFCSVADDCLKGLYYP